MQKYIDGYYFPIAKDKLDVYQKAAKDIALIWKEHGALEYSEGIDDNQNFQGTLSFSRTSNLEPGEVIIFGWITFESKEARNDAHEKVASDPRMNELVAPLVDSTQPFFDAKRMVYGGFRQFV